MKSKFPLSFLAACLLIPNNAFSESVREIIDNSEKQKAEKITAYLKANPDAADRIEGLSHLIASYVNLEEPAKAIPHLREKYELILKDKPIGEVNIDDLIVGTARPLILALAAVGQRQEALALLEKTKSDISAHPLAQNINEFLEPLAAQVKAPGNGDVLDIAFTDLNGHKVDLAAMKGKVVLVDFWATWCPPCVAEMPNVLETYNKYHDQGFEVIGISLDQDKAALESFIKENKLPWAQYFDAKGWENDIAVKYSITSVPATYLIGKNGKVVASNLHGGQLEAEVARQLKAK